MIDGKEQGHALFTQVVEDGERLYPNTSTDGRDTIRHELRDLREGWEAFSDDLGSTKRMLESTISYWTAFEECCRQLNEWLDKTDQKLTSEDDLKNTLPEKKTVLEQRKVWMRAFTVTVMVYCTSDYLV